MAVFNRVSLATGLGITALLSACGTTEGEFPSLERRPYEIDGPNVEPEATGTAAPTELSPDLAEKVKALTDRHEAADAAFKKDLPRVQGIAQRSAGSAAGSENWVNAHLELSRLDNARADSVAALREFDTLIAGQVESDPTYVTLLTAHQEAIATEVTAQSDEIERLSQLIGE